MAGRSLIIGASGQLGRTLGLVLRGSRHEVIETVRRSPKPGQHLLDLADRAGILTTLEGLRPEWILIAGAFCNVDRCESERETCFRVNVEGPRAVAEYARETGAWVVYYSTDHLFDGTRESYAESDEPHPLNLYAESKRAGEEAIRGILPQRHLILRTAWLYGPDAMRRNFVLRLVDQLRAGHAADVPEDQWGSPTQSEDLAAASLFLIERGLWGTFHAAGPDWISRASLALKICATFGLDPTRLRPVPTSSLGQAARRPLRIRLDCRKLKETGCPEFREIEAGLGELSRLEEALQKV